MVLQLWLLVHSAKSVKLAALLAITQYKIAMLASFITILAVFRLVQRYTIPTFHPTNALHAPITAPLTVMQPLISSAALLSPTFPASMSQLVPPLCSIT